MSIISESVRKRRVNVICAASRRPSLASPEYLSLQLANRFTWYEVRSTIGVGCALVAVGGVDVWGLGVQVGDGVAVTIWVTKMGVFVGLATSGGGWC